MSTSTTGPMPEAFGGYIHFLRVHVHQMSQREFCERTGVDLHTLSKVEQGYQAPWDVPTLRRVAAVLDVELADLIHFVKGFVAVEPPHFNERTYQCFICGADITSHTVYHETESGRRICVEHLDGPAHYWTAGRGPAAAPDAGGGRVRVGDGRD